MLTFCSFLQGVRQSKKSYRSIGVVMTGCSVVTAITFTASGFGGREGRALAAYSDVLETQIMMDEPEEIESITEAKIQTESTDVQMPEPEESIEVVHTPAMVSYTEEDYQILLKIVEAEAGICDDKGKILVANVILNRVRSERFPNNIKGVVYQKSQFSPVSNGSINRVLVSQETIDSVNRALAGEDHSNGAMYFMYREGSRPQSVEWFDSKLTFLFQHENHEFFK